MINWNVLVGDSIAWLHDIYLECDWHMDELSVTGHKPEGRQAKSGKGRRTHTQHHRIQECLPQRALHHGHFTSLPLLFTINLFSMKFKSARYWMAVSALEGESYFYVCSEDNCKCKGIKFAHTVLSHMHVAQQRLSHSFGNWRLQNWYMQKTLMATWML